MENCNIFGQSVIVDEFSFERTSDSVLTEQDDGKNQCPLNEKVQYEIDGVLFEWTDDEAYDFVGTNVECPLDRDKKTASVICETKSITSNREYDDVFDDGQHKAKAEAVRKKTMAGQCDQYLADGKWPSQNSDHSIDDEKFNETERYVPEGSSVAFENNGVLESNKNKASVGIKSSVTLENSGVLKLNENKAGQKISTTLFVRSFLFNKIENYEKNVEARIANGYFMRIKNGDIIQFLCGARSTTRRVIDKVKYNSFEELLKKEGIENCLPGVSNLNEAVEYYRSLPKYASMELTYGVLALRLEPKVYDCSDNNGNRSEIDLKVAKGHRQVDVNAKAFNGSQGVIRKTAKNDLKVDKGQQKAVENLKRSSAADEKERNFNMSTLKGSVLTNNATDNISQDVNSKMISTQLMQSVMVPSNSSIKILPMVDLQSSDPTCIFTTLHFLCKEAEKYGVTPTITFDQPLWWKATLIIQDEPVSSPLKKIVLLLGGFHMRMSFLGSIGHLMNGTGLQECLETVYASNSVIHMLSGKSIQRAVRGHFLVNTALNALITKKAETILPENDWSSFLEQCADLYDQLISLQITSDDLHSNELLASLMVYFSKVKETLRKHRTPKMWIQYMDMVDLLRDFIRSERTGNWKLHLATVRKMIPYFAAAGHSNYAKSSQIYLQRMEHLEHDHPDVYNHFMKGNHIVRRSDRFWAGLSCDLTIEQTLMRAAKSRGGFTRGGGCSEDQRMVWIQSMPACAEINIAMQKLTNLYYETSEQHKDCSESRQIRDEKDTKTTYDFLEDRDPFSLEDKALRNIYTGEEAQANVNADDATKIGCNIISKMIGKEVSTHSFENVNKAVTMGANNAILIDGKVVHIDPQLLFHRLMLMSRDFSEDKLKDVFKYELCQKPSSLFDDSGLMREAKTNEFVKQCFAENMAMTNTQFTSDFESNSQHVICGNTFLNRISWKKNQTFRDICLMYVDYARKFNNPTIVFDSVPDKTTMDEYNFRRSKGIRGVNIKFSGHTVFNSKKEHFLANKSNRASFTAMLSEMLIENGCSVLEATTNQNVTIAETAVEMALTNLITVISDDMEIVIMLCYSYKIDGYDIIYKSEECPKKPAVFYSIKNIRDKHEQQVIDNIYFLHAIGGCKTTSHIHSIGKSQLLKKFTKNTEFRSIAGIFLDQTSMVSQIVDAGIRAIAILYDVKINEKLDELRFRQFSKKVSTKKSAVLVNSLPPTAGAAKYHVLRVYFQVQQWLGNRDLDTEKFGWKSKSTISDCCKLVPITTDNDPAPPELLSKIRCQCKGNCSTLKCGCFKNQVKCTSACAVCCGTDCLNIYLPEETYDEFENQPMLDTEVIAESSCL